MQRRLFNVLTIVVLLSSILTVLPVGANPPAPGDEVIVKPADVVPGTQKVKPIDQPNVKDYLRMRERQRLLEAGQTAEAAALAQSGTDRVLVILVEFDGTDVVTWNPGDAWDPLGIADENEYTGTTGDCSNIITQTTTFTYTGPLHNMIERPRALDDRSGQSIWTDDFDPQWFDNFMFGNGVAISYTMQDDTPIYESFIGQSVTDYYSDLSSGVYTITGDVIGWLKVPHSTWWYGADSCPGNRSGLSSGAGADGDMPNAGSTKTLVRDALDAVNAISNTIPNFSWANYDLDGDGIINRLWIVHAGYGEEDGTALLNRDPTDPDDPTRTTPVPEAFYGEAAVWSHSSAVTPPYSVTQDVAAGPYIMMPENGGIGVFAHEYGHNLGAWDLYAYGEGQTSTGFWSLMSDDWTGFPIGFEPPAVDPTHLDLWGWLEPLVITDTTREYTFYLGQASYYSTNTSPDPSRTYRGAKIELPDAVIPMAVPVWQGDYYWWGGKLDQANAMMTTANPIAIPAGGATLSFDLVYEIEDEWDFLWIQASDDGGTTWDTLTNANTQCDHDPGWIGGNYGFPDDLCGAGLGGFYGYNANWPDPEAQTFDLAAYAGQNILLRFWFMTDWATTYTGAFVDNVAVMDGATTIFADNAEAGDANWVYADPWVRSDGTTGFTHNYYVQWRNVNENGGYDSALGEDRWRFGPANTGMLVWYNNNSKSDTEIFNYLAEWPSWGPKGNTLVVDAHPEPYREPDMVAAGYDNEGGNVTSRGQMRDAPFTLQDTVDFTYTTVYAFPFTTTLFTNHFEGRPAVSEFNDALGYYPGAEYVSRGPGYVPPSYKWVTKQWDASVVIPAKASYPLNAPGYDGVSNSPDSEFRFDCASTNTGRLGCYWYNANTGLGYYGGTGNPGDYGVQYGWHVELLEEGADHTWALVHVSNPGLYEVSVTPLNISMPGTHMITYTLDLMNAGALTQTHYFSFTLDPALTYVSHDWTGGTAHLPILEWEGDVPPGGVMYTLVASVTVGLGDPPVALITHFAHEDAAMGRTTDELVTYVGLHPDVWVTKSGPATAELGDVVTFTVNYGNNGYAPAHDVMITDTVVASGTAVWQHAWPISGTLDVGDVFTVYVPITITVSGMTVTNHIEITTSDWDMDFTDNTDMTETWVEEVTPTGYMIYLPIIMKNN